MGIEKSWSRYRLIPSTIAFAIEFTKHCLAADLPDTHYVARNYDVLSIMYSTFLGAIIITGLLKAITAVLLGGSIADVGRSLPADLSLSLEDHFQVTLIKLMAASMQTTAISGLANELPALNAYQPQNKDGDEAVAYIGQNGKVVIGGGARKGGLGREVKKVKAQTMESSDAILGGWARLSRWRALKDVLLGAWRLGKWMVLVLWFRTLAGIGWGPDGNGATSKRCDKVTANREGSGQLARHPQVCPWPQVSRTMTMLRPSPVPGQRQRG